MDYKLLLSVMFIWIVFVSAYFPNKPSTCTMCKQRNTCKPPNCVCCSDEMPLTYKEIPQMVFFTFDDAITPQVASFYRELFDSSRRNPNGCPISMTLFISHSNTVYSLVREFYQKGMEIASHSVSHGHPKTSTFKGEAMKQKQNLARMARIPHTRIKGWRSPFLEPLGDAQPNMLQNLGYSYDATLTISKMNLNERPPVPFTLDYGWPYDCKIKPCPKQRHRGFWEVPVISVMDYLQRFDCVYVDGCNNPPPDEEAAFRFLWDNFQSYYKTNKAPFGMNMHASWFFYPDRLKAMDRFINELVRMDDVFIVNVKQVIDWLRHPASLQDINSFQPWSCKSANGTRSGTQTAFDLRNKQIEQRLKERRQQQFEKQEFEFVRKQRTWAVQEAARKAATKYSGYHNSQARMNTNVVKYPQQRIAPNRSPAMTWQQMLMAHARQQHSQSGKETIHSNTMGIGRTDPLAPRRMVRPVNNRGGPRQREIMLKEQKRIREQQRIAAENRLKLSQNQEEEIHPVPSIKSSHLTVQTVAPRSIPQIRTQHNVQVVNLDMKPNERLKSETNQSNSLSKTTLIITKSLAQPQSPSSKNSNSFQIVQNQKHVDIMPNKGELLLPVRTNVQKPQLQHTIDAPIKREKIRPKTTKVKENIPGSFLLKKTKTVNSHKKGNVTLATPQRRAQVVRTQKPKIQLIGNSWNLFNMKDNKMKIPWRSWIKNISKDDMKSNQQSSKSNKKVGISKARKIRNNIQLNSLSNQKNSKSSKNVKLSKARWFLNKRQPNVLVKPSQTSTTSNLRKSVHAIGKTRKELKKKTLTSNKAGIKQTNVKRSNSSGTVISTNSNEPLGDKPVKTAINLTRSGHGPSISDSDRCQQDVNCFLPDCFCMTSQNHFNMKLNEIPQIVYITFEGDISFLSYSKLRSLFNQQKVNPNGCPIGSTFFVSEEGTSYSLARNLQRYGAEVAMNGIKSEKYENIESFKIDFDKQINTIANRVGRVEGSLLGWRSPKLKVLGDEQFKLLQNKSNVYDSSIVLDRSMKSFPFTLDYGLKQFCADRESCDINRHQGVWEIPIIPLVGVNKSERCVYADNCKYQPMSTDETFSYLMKNFEKYYFLNRAPFGLHLKQKWFHWSFSKNLAGLSKFIDKILEKRDVYVVTVSNLLDWMKKPTKLSDLEKTGRWKC